MGHIHTEQGDESVPGEEDGNEADAMVE